MQQMYLGDTAWRTPWAERVLPLIVRLCEHRAERTCFTRFIPARHPEQGQGAWGDYWRRWPTMTLDHLDPAMVDLAAPLAAFVPPARVLDKHVYSPWIEGELHSSLRRGAVDTLVVTGTETDVCVLAAVLGAVDRGYRVVVATDAICGSADRTHDDLVGFYHDRLSQVETAECEEILDAWR